MLRKLAIAIAASGAMMSAGYVQALGMGDIELESALNQPLDARIKLIKANDLENWEIKPALASEDAFNKAGVERIFFLNNIKFEVEREDGDVYVNVKSQKAVVEPFLNFLVQVDWPNGRLQREYTLLLDPPVFDEEQGIAPVNVASEAVEQEPLSQQQDMIPEPQPEPSLPGTYAEPEPVADDSEQEYQEETEEQSEVSSQPQAVVYEVRENDTLWEVAIRTRPNRNISPQQAMLAIQDLNPDAFINGNINRLKKDQTLEVPTEEQMLSRTFDQAVAEVAAQNQAIAQRKAQLDATRKEQARELDTEVADSELKLLAGGDATSDMDRKASGQVAKDTLGDQSSLEQELSLALENLDKSSRENQELRNRLDSLEEQIGTLQRLINLKDEQMVALQAGMSAEEIEGMTQGEVISDAPKTDVVSEAPASVVEDKDLNFAQDTEVDSQEDAAPEQPQATETSKEVKKSAPKPAPIPPADKPFDPIAFAIDNPPVLGGVLGALLLALLGVKYARKRKEDKAADDIADNQFEADQDPLGDVEVDGDFDDEFSDLELNTDESPLDSDFSQSEDDASGLPESLDQDESYEDVLGQVDVYMAYDRVDSAKSLLEETLEKQPQRHELRLKLLEILAESDMSDDFASQYDWLKANAGESEQAQADQIKARFEGQDAGDFDSDLSMGDDLDLGMDMMSGSDSGEELSLDDLDLGESTSSQLESDELEMDFSSSDLDLSFEESAADTSSSSSSSANNELEFSLDDELDVSFESESVATSELDSAENSLEFDSDLEFGEDLGDKSSDDLSLDSDLPVLEADSNNLSNENELEFDGDFDLPELTNDSFDESVKDDDGLDLDFEGLDGGSSDEIALDEGSVDGDLDVEFSLDEMDDAPNLVSENELPVLDAESASDDAEFDFETELESFETDETSADMPESLDLDISEEIDSADEAIALDEGLEIEAASEDSLPEAAEEISFDNDDDLSLDLDENVASTSLEEELEEIAVVDEPSTAESGADIEPADDLSADDPLADFDIGEDLENLDGDLDFLSGTDESETKLDLARAYIDMDDKEGAREILQEVMEEGSDDHKKEATKLLDSIA
ncbi:hypothetical protein HF888_08925 [Bermanella marisrubri]|uniref:Protein containing tetratricopeptide repeats n=1 Tax=Bermanella marisrubri TaxID=207949 RepID=Q1N6P2_9GAMM|nr:FimV/HubP family polar landmark protein [Bermanella marisrubri]EAT13550.1 protein containing tetratricopeptide repeats [Oceanobacter sp. RED65] [Bermanella marisrubri]QIZ84346.1 hypothetical protein HF888_08925 [Bermanella marisrubri]